jgi:hypothetical protein
MKALAVLDSAGVLTSYEQIEDDVLEDAILPGSRILVPDGCDLAPGKYRWNGQTFIPIGANGQDMVAEELDTVRAITLALMAIRDGKPFPPETLKWLDWYENSFDNLGKFKTTIV